MASTLFLPSQVHREWRLLCTCFLRQRVVSTLFLPSQVHREWRLLCSCLLRYTESGVYFVPAFSGRGLCLLCSCLLRYTESGVYFVPAFSGTQSVTSTLYLPSQVYIEWRPLYLPSKVDREWRLLCTCLLRQAGSGVYFVPAFSGRQSVTSTLFLPSQVQTECNVHYVPAERVARRSLCFCILRQRYSNILVHMVSVLYLPPQAEIFTWCLVSTIPERKTIRIYPSLQKSIKVIYEESRHMLK